MQSRVPLDNSSRVLAILSERAGFNDKVLSVGFWADDEGESNAQLEAALTAAGLLTPQWTTALLFTPNALQFIASSEWKEVNKKIDAPIGFIRLRDDVRVEIDADMVVTTVRGEHKVRFAPNIPFEFRISERLKLQPNANGIGPRLVVIDSKKKMTAGILKVAAILSLLSPALGALTFWKGDELAENIAPTPAAGGAGNNLAARWPTEIMTNIAPPVRLGKFLFLWSELLVDATGVRTFGAFLPLPRTPEIFIKGPGSITLQQPHGWTTVSYQAVFKDLRSPLRRLRWIVDGVEAGRRTTQEISFGMRGAVDSPPETRLIRVEVTDADGLVAAREKSVNFQVTVAPGRQPL